ncbi:MAG: FHA domain-containing protein [Blastocatellia bacterium]
MASEVISDRPAKLRHYRYQGEVLSLALTFIILISLYALATFFFPATWATTVKALLITSAGLAVYITSVKLQQRAALGTLVRVSPRQFPELYDLATKAAERLSTPPVPVFVKRQSEMNIYTVGLWQRPIIVLTSSLVDQMEPANLQFFIGREIGHVAAGHIFLRTLLKPLGADVPMFGKLLNSVVFGDWINRTEFTADRAGLIACRSLTTAVSTMLKFGVGIRLYEKLDIGEFLEQINDVRNVRGHLTEIVAEQPYLTQRIKAIIRFWSSDQYKSLSPEKQRPTRILKAIPENFVTSGIGYDFDDDELPVDQPALGRQEESGKPITAADTLFDEEITVAEYIEIEDVNAPDPNLALVAAGGDWSYTLRRLSTRIGRNSDNDIVIEGDRVSRYHAEIVREGDEMLVVDKKSRNGVWLNGARVKDSAPIISGDGIRIGRQEFTFVVKDEVKGVAKGAVTT